MSKVIKLEDFMKMTADNDPYRYLHLQLGEVPCDNCSATGDDLNNFSPYSGHHACKKCGGEGKVSWIKNIFE